MLTIFDNFWQLLTIFQCFQIFGEFSEFLKLFLTRDMTLDTLISFLTIENNNIVTLWPLNKEWWWQHSQFLRCFGLNSQCTAVNYTCAFMMFVSISRIGYALHSESSDTGTAMHTDACNVVKFYYLLSPQLPSLWPGLPWEKEVFFFEVSSHCRNQNLDSGHGCIDEDKTVVYYHIRTTKVNSPAICTTWTVKMARRRNMTPDLNIALGW